MIFKHKPEIDEHIELPIIRADVMQYISRNFEVFKRIVEERKQQEKEVLQFLKDVVRHNKPKTEFSQPFPIFHYCYWSDIYLQHDVEDNTTEGKYKGIKLPNETAEELYKLYELVWE